MYEIIFSNGNTGTAPTLDAAIDLIASAHGHHRSEIGLDDRSSSCGTVEQYDAWLAGAPGEPIATISTEDADIDVEPPPGWEDRAIERARAEGVC